MLAKDGQHVQEVLECQVALAVRREHLADARSERVLLKRNAIQVICKVSTSSYLRYLATRRISKL